MIAVKNSLDFYRAKSFRLLRQGQPDASRALVTPPLGAALRPADPNPVRTAISRQKSPTFLGFVSVACQFIGGQT